MPDVLLRSAIRPALRSPLRSPLEKGVGAPAWAQGTDLWKDFAGASQGTLAGPTDTHASTIYAPNAAGVYAPFAANVLTRTDLGLQTVPTRTQMYDADPSDATLNAGNRAGHTITSNATTDAFGGNDGDKVDLIAGGSYCYWRVNTAAAAVARSGFLILRADAPVTLRLRMADDLGTDTTVVSINVTTSWQRFDIADLSHTASSFTEIGIDARSGVAGGDNLAKSFYISHRQMEAAAFSSAPIRTASATVNGNQQVIDLTGRLGTGVAGIVQVTVNQPSTAGTNYQILNFNDGTGANRLNLFLLGGGGFRIGMDTASVGQGTVDFNGYSQGTKVTIAFAWTGNYFTAQAVGQSAPTPDTVSTFPSGMTQLSIGNRPTNTDQIYQTVSKLALSFGPQDATTFAAALARAQLAAVS